MSAGMLWWGFTMVCFTGGLFYMSYTTNQPPSRTHMVPGLDEDGYNLYVDFYEAPWVRYQPYLVGILLGYILHHTREKQVKINNAANILLWQAAFLAGFAVVYGLYGVRTQTMTHFSASIYNSFQRLAWSGALAWVIFSCAKGYGGVVNDLLSWSLFAPLARITFCTYLIHTNLLGMFTSSVLLSFPFDFSFWVSVWHFLGSLSISLTVGFFLSMFFESPSVRLEKLLIGSVLQGLIPNSGKHYKD
ncbi:nose resistant to fluoxetine protein 6 isoform X2 [Eurytemora carolleeae]|uniref:nose resistant to fluoxetine protein 6 isoform X2 n=1 Tax=Eurytemora carolleeae TaxID=1294199 RepID=UPI000C7866C7|nr:nose resistant to fluoxetine protein 6 isoform X2 [Eurytemora carolleeae]|eukprot:XP_023338416.1 nose resistant to fluoxetine protein 6-like isoform X2 [Eurytemora affinis]